MSKVEELRVKYPSLTNTTFSRFVNGDKTKTKKYLPFMLKTWVNRTSQISNSTELVKLVNMFDELLPFINNKDIYSKEYENIEHFLDVLNDAMVTKEDGSFVKEDHVRVLYECEKFILLHPKTHKGSCKYGSNTKWCTSSKKDEGTFNRYSKGGFLSYLISKREDHSGPNYKIAFFSRKADDPLIDSLEVYNAVDNRTNTTNILSDLRWDVHEIFEMVAIHRANFANWKRLEYSKDTIKGALANMEAIDFTSLANAVKVVENDESIDYITDIKNRLNEFIQKIPKNL
jgi:hypothetical protein